ncbi:hypothetical protein BGZ94_003355, partial [Podila epigama]
MGLYNACGLPWISTVVNNYIANPPTASASKVEFNMCCLSPGDCTTNPVAGTCPLGNLNCQLGNSRYTCRFRPAVNQGPTCYDEGTLAYTRDLPCCSNQLTGFLKTQPCIGAFSTVNNATLCCTSTDAASCDWSIACFKDTPYYCMGGVKGSVCYGYTAKGQSTDKCVQELGLGTELRDSCMTMELPNEGTCTLGGGGPPAPFPLPTTPAKPSAKPTGPSGPDPSRIAGELPGNAARHSKSMTRW